MQATLDFTRPPVQPIPNSMPPRKSARIYLFGAGLLFITGLILSFFAGNTAIDFAMGSSYFVIPVSHFTFMWMGYFLFLAFVCWMSLVWLNKVWLVSHFTITLAYYFLLFFPFSKMALSGVNNRYYSSINTPAFPYGDFVPTLLGVYLLLQIMWFVHWVYRFYKERVKSN